MNFKSKIQNLSMLDNCINMQVQPANFYYYSVFMTIPNLYISRYYKCCDPRKCSGFVCSF